MINSSFQLKPSNIGQFNGNNLIINGKRTESNYKRSVLRGKKIEFYAYAHCAMTPTTKDLSKPIGIRFLRQYTYPNMWPWTIEIS